MDLSTNSIGWHRTRQWLDSELERVSTGDYPRENLTDEQKEYLEGFLWGQEVAYMRVRTRFNTPEESAKMEKTRREMFG